MQLDGETNLKIKKAPDETKDLTAEGLRGFAGAPAAARQLPPRSPPCSPAARSRHPRARRRPPATPPPQVTVHCEPPNSRLYHFTGNLELPLAARDERALLPVAPASVLLRGCSLRNTHRVYGLVLYAGERDGRGGGGARRTALCGPARVRGACTQ